MTRIIIDAVGGLGNRLRAIKASIDLTQRMSATLDLAWGTGAGCNCEYSELFELPEKIDRVYTFHRSADEWIPVVRYLDIPHCLAIDQAQMRERVESNFDLLSLRAYQSVVISTHMNFCGDDRAMNQFRPANSLQRAIDGIAGAFQHTIGVHIRRSDNDHSIRHSPTEHFLRAIALELERAANASFFLCTDDPAEEGAVRAEFGDRIISHSKSSLDRMDPSAIRAAVVDLYCLARCRKIIGSYWSSFSWAASKIGGIPLDVVTVNQQH